MSLRDRLRELDPSQGEDIYERFGILSNPFPPSNRTTGNPRSPMATDKQAEDHVVTFFRDNTSQVVVIKGTQGVGKTNFLNYFETEVQHALRDQHGYYVVRYLADPEESFDGTTRRLIEELGKEHLNKLVKQLTIDDAPIEAARNHDMRMALRSLVKCCDQETKQLMMEWLLGLRLLKQHRQALGVQFRLDTVESKTAALRDLAQVSGDAKVLRGIFLLLDEIEKQGSVLGLRAIMRYLSALRAMIDALPQQLFLMIAVTPNALNRYSEYYPALRSRLEVQLELKPLNGVEEAQELATFYLDEARQAAERKKGNIDDKTQHILGRKDVEDCFDELEELARKRGDEGVRQREFLHRLHQLAEDKLE